MNRLFLNKKLTAIVLVTVLMISSFLTACRKPLVEMSSNIETDNISQNVVMGDTAGNESQSATLGNSSTIQQNSPQSQVSSGTISSKEELTKPSIPNVSPESNFWSDNTDPEGVVVSDKNTFIINTANTGKTLSSFFNNINVWGVHAPSKDSKYDIYEFVDYVQLMQCSGGSGNRDLFKNPADSSVLDDYDFTRLINACRGILNLGAKPILKLGGVPIKFTKNYQNGYYNMNANPPDDYNVYYNYIYALADALVKEFGRQEVLSWRFGVMTEYENKEWFIAKSGDANDTKIAYFKLYDYTVQALIDAIGEDVFVGAHSMTCTEGMWDEAEFIEHVAKGTNYATGKIGTKISYLSASYYHQVAGTMTAKRQKTFVQTMSYLQDAAKKHGLNNLEFGVDEGRMLMGINPGRNSFDLNNRVVGYSYQGAFDAKLYKDAVDNDIDYFSSWGFLGSTNMPTVSYYVAKNTSKFDGLKQLETVKKTTSSKEADIQAVSAYDPATKTLRIMAYNFKNDYEYNKKASLSFTIAAPIQSGSVSIIKEYVNDDCNYFDEWLKDRKDYNITNDMFSWSPDDPSIEAFLSNASEELKNVYYKKLKPNYLKASVLNPKVENANISGGRLTLNDTIDGNSVVFYEIKF
ncbi:MAG: hypothetical protein E7521_01730 [Ruminococcaceae bacterium]|nr:hypothetical protein [Oscillospiraceae bacterium]